MTRTESSGVSRRRLLAMVGLSAGATLLAKSSLFADDKSDPVDLPATMPGTNTSFDALKQIDAGLLNVGYAEAGPLNGRAVILLDGWPYDIHSYVDVAPLLGRRQTSG